MPGGHPNARHQADRRADPVIALAIERGYLNTDEPFDVPRPDHNSANELRLSLNRSAQRQNLSVPAWVADANGEECNPRKTTCRDPEGPHYVRFRVYDKKSGRAHVFRSTGGDPAQLKYNPWARKGPKFTDSGERA